MNTQTQQEIINLINQISIATTDKANDEYQIELLTQHLIEIAKSVDIRTMFVPDGKIGDAGAIALAAILKQNTTLEQLAIQNHNIGDKGAIALAEGLKQNTTVRLIDLSHNKIGEVGIVVMAEAIKQNATIELVILEGIDMAAKGSAALNEVWERVREVKEEEDPHQNCVGCGCCVPDWL